MTDTLAIGSKRKGKQHSRPNAAVKDRPTNPLMIPFAEAHRLLKHLPGYFTRTSARTRIIEENQIPYEKVGKKGEIWVLGPAVHDKIGTIPAHFTVETEDQRLIKHFKEKETNNYISAMETGLASTLTHAKRIYEEYLIGKDDPRVLIAKAKEAHNERLAKQELGCTECVRTYQGARDDSKRITREVTGDRDIFTLAEEYALIELQEFRCPKCRQWRIPVPLDRMRECLRAIRAPATSTSEANVAETAPSDAGLVNLTSPETATSATLLSGRGSEEPDTNAPTKNDEKPAESALENLVQNTGQINQ
jgi:hypothetical protein